jgi:AbrB family looped-hinge helix DNA binding protein
MEIFPTMSRIVIRRKGLITIPADVREAAFLQEGDLLEVELVDEGILLRPCKVIDATQAWFWHRAWQESERKAQVDLAAGRSTVYETSEDFLASFEE